MAEDRGDLANFNICGRLLTAADAIDEIASVVIVVRLRLLFRVHHVALGIEHAESELRARIIEDRNALDQESRDFYTQIEFFTPLIYFKDGWPGLERFIERVLVERDLILPNSKNAIQDDLIKIKAIVWCAGQGGNKVKDLAWAFLFKACSRNHRLLLKLNFWKQAVRLLVGKLAIWLNVKWHQLFMKF